MNTPLLQIKNITKSFGTVKVLKSINLDINKGEFITLLGSSGSGKTTLLRILAGLENCDSGNIFLNGLDITKVEPNKRDINTVFQNYALFPHMNVFDNIAYGLKIKKYSKDKIKQSVADALELVKLQEYSKRYPSELSGGQKQRVAIARAIINNPSILLLDEPLGALDLQLRRQMQIELKHLQKKLNITFIYITHDQEEALNMSDRICVLHNGIFEQIGTPSEIYDFPKSSYVARFVGQANIIKATVEEIFDDGTVVVNKDGVKMRARKNGFTYNIGDNILVSVRSEHIEFDYKNEKKSSLTATVKEKSFAGGMLRILLELEDKTKITASRLGIDINLELESKVNIYFETENAVVIKEEAN